MPRGEAPLPSIVATPRGANAPKSGGTNAKSTAAQVKLIPCYTDREKEEGSGKFFFAVVKFPMKFMFAHLYFPDYSLSLSLSLPQPPEQDDDVRGPAQVGNRRAGRGPGAEILSAGKEPPGNS